MSPDERNPSTTNDTKPAKRSWRSRVGELLFWFVISLATAAILIALSENLLPTNF
ncbi:MAG: hypothetical protein H0U16_01845 [Actinobacteria bacterium]|nr:hypothetical protein [Actinomycetota bacterium]